MLKAVPRVVGLAVVWLVLTGCASSTVRFPNATPAMPREVPGQVYRPEGTGPFPAVVLLHGCQGVLPSTRPWGRWFKGRGYLALVVDSWAARGITANCSTASPEDTNNESSHQGVGLWRDHKSRNTDPTTAA